MIKLKFIAQTLLFLLFVFQGFAQKAPIKFGKVSMDEMKMSVYDKDTTAKAVVLADFNRTEITYDQRDGFVIAADVVKRIKILKKEGLDEANIEIPFYYKSPESSEEIFSLKAQCHNLENGKIVSTKLSNKDVFEEDESKFWKLKKFAIPNVKVGSVIEFSYKFKSPFLQYFPEKYFQDLIPIAWSEYIVMIPEYFEYKKIVGGDKKADILENNTTGKTILISIKNEMKVGLQREGTAREKPRTERVDYMAKITRWVYKDLPALRNEEYITSLKNYSAKVEFELLSTRYPGSGIKTYTLNWEQVITDLLIDDNFGSALNREGIVKELTEQINLADPEEKKLVQAYYLLKKHMKWNGRYSIYARSTLRNAFNRNEGNTGEINLLLVNLLRSVGVNAAPVLISTRSHGQINTAYPRDRAFNSVVVMANIGGKSTLLDATIGYLTPGELSYSSLNGKGLIATKGKAVWIDLLRNERKYESVTTMAKIENEKMSAQIIKSYKSASATIKRNEIAEAGKEKFIENYKEKNTDWTIAEYKIENEDDPTETLKENITVESIDNIDVTEDIIYLPALLTAEVEENPFKSETRDYPIDFAMPIFKKHMVMITIPAGYEVSELPEVAKVTLPNNAGLFLYQAQKVGNNIQVLSQLKIDKVVFAPQEYNLLKELYRLIIDKYSEQIVLKRIEE